MKIDAGGYWSTIDQAADAATAPGPELSALLYLLIIAHNSLRRDMLLRRSGRVRALRL